MWYRTNWQQAFVLLPRPAREILQRQVLRHLLVGCSHRYFSLWFRAPGHPTLGPQGEVLDGRADRLAAPNLKLPRSG
jgi:hypothetical protein